MNEHRAPRFAINGELSALEKFIAEYATDISSTGVFMRSKDPLPPGTRVNLCFSVFADEIEVIEGIGNVVRVSRDPEGMGVAFVELTGTSEQSLSRVLTRGNGSSARAAQ